MGFGKQKVSRRMIEDSYSCIFGCGYCGMQNIALVCKFEKVGYTCGYLGWNYDVIELNAYTCVTTGYRGWFGKEIPDLRVWDQKARKIRDVWCQPCYTRKANKFKKDFLAYIDSLCKDEKDGN